jgi:hypothetical protein
VLIVNDLVALANTESHPRVSTVSLGVNPYLLFVSKTVGLLRAIKQTIRTRGHLLSRRRYLRSLQRLQLLLLSHSSLTTAQFISSYESYNIYLNVSGSTSWL